MISGLYRKTSKFKWKIKIHLKTKALHWWPAHCTTDGLATWERIDEENKEGNNRPQACPCTAAGQIIYEDQSTYYKELQE